jgi:hypothetical protein
VELYDVAGNVLSECSGVDSEWSSGGVGFDAYLDSGEAVYFDDCVIVHKESPYKGGWGPNHVVSYDSEPTNYHADGDWNQVDDFHFFLNYDGAKELVNDDGSTDKFVHVFHAGAIFQTYKKEATFKYDPRQKDLAPEAIQGGTKIHGFVSGSQSTTSITPMNDKYTWAFAAGRTEWSNWKDDDSNWDNQVRFDEFKRNAIEAGPLDEGDSDSVAKLLYFAFNSAIALTAPSGVAIAISTIELLGDLAFNPDSNCTGGDPNTDSGEQDVEWIEWDWCDPMTLSVSMRSFEVKVEPGTGHSDVRIRHGVLPADNFSTDNACQWSIRCPASMENATWTAETYSGDVPPEFDP